MYCSRTLSLTDQFMSLSNGEENVEKNFFGEDEVGISELENDDDDFMSWENREKDVDIVMNPLPMFFEQEVDLSEKEKTDDCLSDTSKCENFLQNDDSNINIINQDMCDNNVRSTLKELNEDMSNLTITNMDSVKNFIVNQLMSSSEESQPPSKNIDKDLNHNDKVNNAVLEDDLHLFNSNIYWYISPDLPLDPSIIAGKEQTRNETSNFNTVSIFF